MDASNSNHILKGSYVWAKLPGCKVIWPVMVVKVHDRPAGNLTVYDVYSHSDDSEIVLYRWRVYGQLKKKKSSLAAFLNDYNLAEEAQKWSDMCEQPDPDMCKQPGTDMCKQPGTDNTKLDPDMCKQGPDNTQPEPHMRKQPDPDMCEQPDQDMCKQPGTDNIPDPDMCEKPGTDMCKQPDTDNTKQDPDMCKPGPDNTQPGPDMCKQPGPDNTQPGPDVCEQPDPDMCKQPDQDMCKQPGTDNTPDPDMCKQPDPDMCEQPGQDMCEQPGTDNTKPDPDMCTPGPDNTQPGADMCEQPDSDMSKPGPDNTQPGLDNTQPGPDMCKQPGQDMCKQPGPDNTQPDPDMCEQPDSDMCKPGPDNTQPGPENTQPGADMCEQPDSDMSKPGPDNTQPGLDNTQPGPDMCKQPGQDMCKQPGPDNTQPDPDMCEQPDSDMCKPGPDNTQPGPENTQPQDMCEQPDSEMYEQPDPEMCDQQDSDMCKPGPDNTQPVPDMYKQPGQDMCEHPGQDMCEQPDSYMCEQPGSERCKQLGPDNTQPGTDNTEPGQDMFEQPDPDMCEQPEPDIREQPGPDMSKPGPDITQPGQDMCKQPGPDMCEQPDPEKREQPDSDMCKPGLDNTQPGQDNKQPGPDICKQPGPDNTQPDPDMCEPGSERCKQLGPDMCKQPGPDMCKQPSPENKPDSDMCEQPDSDMCEQPDSDMCEQPDSDMCEQPDSDMCEQPDSGLCEQPDSGMCEQPDSDMCEQPDSDMCEQPDPDMCEPQCNLASFKQQQSSSLFSPSEESGSEYDVSVEESSGSEYIPDKVRPSSDFDFEIIENSADSGDDGSDIMPFIEPVLLKRRKVDEFECLDSDEEDLIEDEIMRDPIMPNIYIKKIIKSSTTKAGRKKKSNRVYNMYQYCGFCAKKVSNFGQHINRVHTASEEVKPITVEQVPALRKKKIGLLRAKFNHEHNLKTLDRGKGEIILERRPCDKFMLNDYGPCPHCLSWISKKLLWKHHQKCNNQGTPLSGAALRIQSDALAHRLKPIACPKVVKEVFECMTDDDIGATAKNDDIIVSLGNQWMEKNIGNTLNRGKYTRQVIRLIGRFLLNLRLIKPIEDPTMFNYLKPEYFEDLVNAAMKTAQVSEEDDTDVDKPSVLIKLGFDLKRMINIKIAMSIQSGNKEGRTEGDDLLKLMQVMWSTRVTKLARVVLNERHFNKECKLPNSDDIERLNDYLKKEISELNLVKEDPENFQRVVELICSKLVLYNRRRTGELESLRLKDYMGRRSGTTNSELIGKVTAFERYLLESQEILDIRGKTGRKVPVILPNEVGKGLAFLSDPIIRRNCGILQSNIYVFANKGNGVVRAYESLSKSCKKANLKSPEKITSTNLRKYMATITQVLDLNTNQLEWVTSHMGHSVDVHKHYYRSTSDEIERIQVAKILLLMDTDNVEKFSNKKLEDIQLDDIITNENSDEENFKEDPFEPEDFIDDQNATPKRRKCIDTRTKWTKEEEEEILIIFKPYFEKKIRPKPSACKKAIDLSRKKNGYIFKRSKETLKKKLFRMIDKINK